jgi:glyoxylase-like metal-dependent hydrolase (beta-lactamase superfamily II)
MKTKIFAPALVLAIGLATVALLAQAPENPGQRGGGAGRGAAPGGRGGAPDPVEKIRQLKPNLYLITGAGANTLVRVTPEGLIVADTKNPGDQIAADLIAQIRSVSTLPVKYVFNTHHHPDHVGNNQKFVDMGATVIGLDRLKNLMTTDARTKDIPGVPTVLFTQDYSLKFGGAQVDAHYYGSSHTGGDTIVHFVDSKVVMVSDTMPLPNATPGINPSPNNGSAVQVPKLLENILKLDFDTAIAGRGEPMTKADVQAYKAKWDTFMSRAKDAIKKGVSKEEFMASVKQDDLGWNFNQGFFNNFYDELKATGAN